MCPDRPKPAAHPTALLFDFLEGRLPDEVKMEVERHLAGCTECARLFAIGHTLRADVLDKNVRHISFDRLIALADEHALEPDQAEEAHLRTCTICREHRDHLRTLTSLPESAPERIPGETTAGSGGRWWKKLAQIPAWGWSAATVAAVGIAVLLILPQGAENISPARYAIVAPLEVQWSRGDEPGGAPRTIYRDGLLLYAAGDFAGAIRELEAVAQRDPRHEDVFLFLGSARLLEGEAAAAVTDLRRARENATGPELLDECSWQLANALLQAGELGEARQLLARVAEGASARSPDAHRLLERMGDRPGEEPPSN